MKLRFLQLLIFGLIYTLCTWTLYTVDAFDWLYRFSRDHEEWELDEIIVGSVVGLFFLLLWFLVEVWLSRKVLRDKIHELGEARHETAALQELLAQAYRTSPALFIITRLSDGHFIRVNDAWTSTTGYSIDDIEDQTDLSLGLWQNPQDREYFILHTYAQKSLRNFEAVFITKNHEEKHMLLSGEIVEYDGQDCLLIVGMDISDRFEIEQTKNQFISIVSNELRTPLTSMQGTLQLLLSGTCGIFSGRAKQMLEMAEHNANQLLHLVDDILDLEKLRSGTLIYNMGRTSLETVIKEAIKSNTPLADQNSIRLVDQIQTTEAFINGDKRRLAQVMYNLISNAVEASTPHNKINVGLQTDGDTYRVSVTDFGAGIPEDCQKGIFQPFSSTATSGERQRLGAGLGLSISKAIVEHHGGNISFETDPGAGTTFYFTLPAL